VRVLATHSIRQFPLHFPTRASPCATRFRTSSNKVLQPRLHRLRMTDLVSYIKGRTETNSVSGRAAE